MEPYHRHVPSKRARALGHSFISNVTRERACPPKGRTLLSDMMKVSLDLVTTKLARSSISAMIQPALCRLAPELRNRIYELVLIVDEPLSIDRVNTAIAAQPPLTRVCKFLRNEALSTFYSSNRFTVEAEERDVFSAKHWITAIGAQNARHLRKLEVQFFPGCCAAPRSAADDELGLSKAFHSMGVCRDAVTWLCSAALTPEEHSLCQGEVWSAPLDSDDLAGAYLVYAGYPSKEEVPVCVLYSDSRTPDGESRAMHVVSANKTDASRAWVLQKVWPSIKHRYPHIPLERATDFYYNTILRAQDTKMTPTQPVWSRDLTWKLAHARYQPDFDVEWTDYLVFQEIPALYYHTFLRTSNTEAAPILPDHKSIELVQQPRTTHKRVKMTSSPSLWSLLDFTCGSPVTLTCWSCGQLCVDAMKLPCCDRTFCSHCCRHLSGWCNRCSTPVDEIDCAADNAMRQKQLSSMWK